MIRVKVLLSIVLVSVLSSACQKESKKNPAPAQKPAGPGQPMLNGQPPAPSTNGSGIDAKAGIENPNSKQQADRTSKVISDDGTYIDGGGEPAQSSGEQTASAIPGLPAPKSASPSEKDSAPADDLPAVPAPPAKGQPAQSSAEAPADTSSGDTTTATTVTKPPAALQQNPPEQNAAAPADANSKPVIPKPEEIAFVMPAPPISPTLHQIFHADDPKLAPGFARELAPAPKSTEMDNENFTDAANDDLLNKALAGFAADAKLQVPNKEFSESIEGLQLATTDNKQFTLSVDLEKTGRLIFSGARIAVKPGTKQKVDINLPGVQFLRTFELKLDSKQSTQGLAYNYRAHVYCSDEDTFGIIHCQNAVIEIRKYDLNQQGKNKKVLAKAFAVHRFGPAIVMLAPERAKEVNNKVIEPSPMYHELSQYLIDSNVNVCFTEKSRPNADVKRLNPYCANSSKLPNAASDIYARTWAVAKGRAQYELIFANFEDSKDIYFSASMIIRGAMVMPNDPAQATAFVEDRSGADRDKMIKEVQLVNSDGAGAFILNLKFADANLPQMISEERISITTDFLKAYAPEVRHEKKKQPTVTSDASPTGPKTKRKKITAQSSGA